MLIICAILTLLFIFATLPRSIDISGACPALCAFIEPVPWSITGYIGNFHVDLALIADICILCWAYPTTFLFVFPPWYKYYHFIVWKIPSRFVRSLRRFGLSIGTRRFRIAVDRQIQGTYYVYRQIFFPSQGLAIVVQVILWCIHFTVLVMDRAESQTSITVPGAENQWEFGQLLAMIILFLPFLTLLETWAGESSSLGICYPHTLLTCSVGKRCQDLRRRKAGSMGDIKANWWIKT